MDQAEVDQLEREGNITPDDTVDERLPGPFVHIKFYQNFSKAFFIKQFTNQEWKLKNIYLIKFPQKLLIFVNILC